MSKEGFWLDVKQFNKNPRKYLRKLTNFYFQKEKIWHKFKTACNIYKKFIKKRSKEIENHEYKLRILFTNTHE